MSFYPCNTTASMISGDDSPSVKGYSVLYSTLMALLVLAIVLCNLGAMRNLYTMHQRLRRHTRCCSLRDRAGEAFPQSLEELDHLLLLALMTVLFTMCTLPLVYRAYYGAFKAVEEEPDDLLALRFLSVISIVDPWIFIIFRTSVFRMFFHKIFIRPLLYRNWHCHFYQTNVESSL